MNVRTLCLGILHFGAASGYEIRKLASDGAFSHFIEASYGAIYPALTKLTDDGLVTWHEEREPGKPATKIYAITNEGRVALANELHTMPREDLFKSETLFTALFAELVDAEHLSQVLAAYERQHRDEIERLEAAAARCGHPGIQFAIQYGLAINRAALKAIAIEGPKLKSTAAQTATGEPKALKSSTMSPQETIA